MPPKLSIRPKPLILPVLDIHLRKIFSVIDIGKSLSVIAHYFIHAKTGPKAVLHSIININDNIYVFQNVNIYPIVLNQKRNIFFIFVFIFSEQKR